MLLRTIYFAIFHPLSLPMSPQYGRQTRIPQKCIATLDGGHQQLSFVSINGQLAARGEGWKWLSLKVCVTKPATIFYMVITTFKKYFYKIDINLKLH